MNEKETPKLRGTLELSKEVSKRFEDMLDRHHRELTDLKNEIRESMELPMSCYTRFEPSTLSLGGWSIEYELPSPGIYLEDGKFKMSKLVTLKEFLANA